MEPGCIGSILPRGVREVCRTLAGAGETAWVVGGCLRDILRGRVPRDWDIATTARPERVLGLFRRVVPTGIAHGTVTVLMGDESIEVTTLRGEGSYSDGRRPDSVEFLDDIADDLSRRDFTINAMAWDPASGALHDPFGGRVDLRAGVIRAVGDPGRRFAEDGLRVLRAARFAATLGFAVEPATREAARAAAAMLERVSAERKREELVRMLLAPDPTPGLTVLLGSGMAPWVLSPLGEEIAARGEEVAERAVVRVAAAASLPVRLAALLFETSLSSAIPWLWEMRCDRDTRRRVALLLEAGPGAIAGEEQTPAVVRRRLSRMGRAAAPDLLELVAAQEAVGGPCAFLPVARAVLDAGDPLWNDDLALGGNELMSLLGIGPGPDVGRILSALLDHVFEHPGDNRVDRLADLAGKTFFPPKPKGRVQ